MALVKKYKYKNILIDIDVYENGYFHASALGILSSRSEHNHHGHSLMNDCIKDIESKIDDFLLTTPKTYKELANAITDSLVWTGYEECHAEEFIIETLVENFLKIK